MDGKKVVRLVIEVPADIVVHPIIVQKPGTVLRGGSTTMKTATFDLTNAKAATWLNAYDPPSGGSNCCCVRG